MAEKMEFQAEVSKILDIVVNSLYSERHIFLRELISNASDACDKLRYSAIMKPDLAKGSGEFRIELATDEKANTLTVFDNGIGMNKDDMVRDLGTIAKSGSQEFLNNLTGDAKQDMALIGRFGVGFYSVFMVAERVEVRSKKAGEELGWLWTSEGKGRFEVEECDNVRRGTEIKIFLKDDAKEFADKTRLRHIIRTYSDHVAIPVVLISDGDIETVNSASALWTRNKSEITDEQYKEFYHHVAHAFDEPWMTLHYKAEGMIQYTGLLYIPGQPPFDLFQPDRKPQLKLYVNRIFISDEVKDLMPSWLRFVKGVVDSPDLPLNVSREILQHNVLIRKIKNGLVRRLLDEIKKQSEDKESYAKFWKNFGAVLKEGIYEEAERRTDIAKLCRFYSTRGEELTSFDEYVSRMKEGQKTIYYITGDDVEVLRRNPQLEGFAAKDVEVLLLTDPIDEFWPQTMTDYDGKQIKPVGHARKELEDIGGADDTDRGDAVDKDKMEALTVAMKEVIGDGIKDIATTDKLTTSAVCLTTGEGEMSLHLERLMRQHQQKTMYASGRILELNPWHPVIASLAEKAKEKDASKSDGFKDAVLLLFDQAKIVEGEPISDPSAFARRLTDVMVNGMLTT